MLRSHRYANLQSGSKEQSTHPSMTTIIGNSRKVLEKHLRLAEIEDRTEQGFFLCNAPVLYAESLFISRCQRRSKNRPWGGVKVGHLWCTHETAGRA